MVPGTPLAESIDMSVVGFVLAAPERNVRGSENCDEDERDGVGEGGEVGGKGLIDASSSASFAGDIFVHIESVVVELRSVGMSWSSLSTTVRAVVTGSVIGSETERPRTGPGRKSSEAEAEAARAV